MFTISVFGHLLDGLRQVHRRRRNERLMKSLPPQIQKDVGWPDPLGGGAGRNAFWKGGIWR